MEDEKINKRKIGGQYENMACEYLANNGLTIIEKNYRNRFGEIDIIAKEASSLVFVEVKYRKTASTGSPEEAVNYYKMKNICKICDFYRVHKKISYDTQIRFDVVAISGDKIRWHKNAFPYYG